MSVGADEVGESVMASIAATCILVCHCERRLARGWWQEGGGISTLGRHGDWHPEPNNTHDHIGAKSHPTNIFSHKSFVKRIKI